MKVSHTSAVIIFGLAVSVISVASTYSGGNGLSESTAYRISRQADWAELMATPSDWSGKYFVITADIDLFGLLVSPVGNSTTPFSGVLEGGHHTMDRLVMNLPQSWDTGLFGVLSATAQVRNLGVNAVYIVGFNYVGVLAGRNSGTISSCYASGTVSGGYGSSLYQGTMGGLTGYNTGTIDSCSSTAAVNNAGRVFGLIGSVGGLTGYNGGTIINCNAAGTINANESFTGGLMGSSGVGTTITDSFSTGNVIAAGEYTITGGLIGTCGAGMTITNCHATGTVSGPEGTGGLIGFCEQDVTIAHCYSTGTVTGGDYYAGGLVAYGNAGMTITDCYATGNVSGPRYVGGLAGQNGGTIENCSAAGAVSGSAQVGGLVGINSGTITRCFARGDVGTYYCGGLVGQNDGTITACYAEGNVYGQHDIGGLVGDNFGTISSCYATGAVQAFDPPVGGLIGVNGQALTGCFWNTETSGTLNGVGTGSATGIDGKTTAQMKTQSTFTGWDFAAMWFMPFDRYPHLGWDRYSGGSGTAATPYTIDSVEDLYDLMGLPGDWDMQFVLTTDLDLAPATFTRALIAPDTDAFVSGFQGTVFCGVFDGGGHVIANLTINNDVSDYQGLFGFVGQTGPRGKGGVIRDLGLVNAVVAGADYTGSLAGKIHHGTVNGCFSTGSVTSHDPCTGGLIGYLGPGSAELWTCAVSDSYSKSTVNGYSYVGGLIGINYQSQVERCYSIGRVDATSNSGGLVGIASGGAISASYFHVKAGPNNGLGTPLSTLQFKQQNSFLGWDFDQRWGICEGTNYPRLKYQVLATDWVCPDGVNLADLAYLAGWWLADNCDTRNNCGKVDLDLSGDVNIYELLVLAEQWLH